LSELYIKGKVVNGIQVNGYLTVDRFNLASKSGFSTDSLCVYLFDRIGKYKGVKSINFIDIKSLDINVIGNYSQKIDVVYIKINANVLTSKKLYNINREYNIEFDLPKIKSELRDMKLRELEI